MKSKSYEDFFESYNILMTRAKDNNDFFDRWSTAHQLGELIADNTVFYDIFLAEKKLNDCRR